MRVPAIGCELLLLEEAVDEQRELGETAHRGDQPAVADAPLVEIVRARLTEQAGLDTVHAIQLVQALALLAVRRASGAAVPTPRASAPASGPPCPSPCSLSRRSCRRAPRSRAGRRRRRRSPRRHKPPPRPPQRQPGRPSPQRKVRSRCRCQRHPPRRREPSST